MTTVRIINTRAAHQLGPVRKAVESRGGTSIDLPVIRIAGKRPDFLPGPADWLVFTSVNSVAQWRRIRPWQGEKVACVGKKTADAAQAAGYPVTLLPPGTEADAEGLAAVLCREASGSRILYPRSARARPVLVRELAACGCEVEAPVVYDTVTDPSAAGRLEREVQNADAILLYSPSAVQACMELLPDGLPPHLLAGCIGRVTEEAFTSWSTNEYCVPEEPDTETLIELLFEKRSSAT
ncbi:uroporphyrinogen-III synthase [Alkalicoccus urumqiensis]|uniref:uroporphyrinogen-III synthase n=1 Tax=Alkalicoccus urumqiensis TaxID=1548213 RepID=UPI0015E5A505|nr:uroporphyrinogen-III synthase [Alkalicoccus urumqiensis]